jgi:hypothetical protein
MLETGKSELIFAISINRQQAIACFMKRAKNNPGNSIAEIVHISTGLAGRSLVPNEFFNE